MPSLSQHTGADEVDLMAEVWTAMAGPDAPPPVAVALTGSPGNLSSPLAVETTAVACVGSALVAAAVLAEHRSGRAPTVSLDRRHVADAVRSERVFSVGGRSAGVGFAPLSRFWEASDGWVRTHANYPWHRRALLETLGTADDVEAVAAAVAGLGAEDVERRVFAGGGIAAAVRSPEAWRDHPQGRALAGEPLVGHRRHAPGAPRRREASELPLEGVRVLDLTRVIAGPVCTRFLAALGADVLRLDPPGHLDMAVGTGADTLLGKRSTLVDLATPTGAVTLHELLDGADVVVCGYRPGALDRFGLDEESLAGRHPGVVAVYLDAWGHHGPWAGRRGFDSVVQAPTGIAVASAGSGVGPGALPCQLLDHGTGYLAAAAALDGLRRQGQEGGSHVRRLSLARTARWLLSVEPAAADRPPPPEADAVPSWVVELDGPGGPVTAVAPPGTLGDRPLRWERPPGGYGTATATWGSGGTDGGDDSVVGGVQTATGGPATGAGEGTGDE